MGQIGKLIATGGTFTIMFGEAMLKEVTPAMFARYPVNSAKPVHCNHPAWVYGHLAIYSSKMLEMMERPVGITAKPEGWEDLFKNGSECRDDAAGTIYPKMEALSSHFLKGYTHVMGVVPEVSDEILMKANPAGGGFAERFPTVGSAVNFLLTGHALLHLGQVSTWRRCMGLGSAF